MPCASAAATALAAAPTPRVLRPRHATAAAPAGPAARPRRAACVRAAAGGGPSGGGPKPSEDASRRSLLLKLLAVAVSVPVAKELLQDLGQGIDEEGNAFAPLPQPGPGQAVATFAGGCFWCMEAPFDAIDGVLATTSGYTGGSVQRPTYLQTCTGTTGHAEAVQVLYDTSKVTYQQLLDVFWHNINPTTPNQQFVDRGPQYRSAVFYHTPEQKAAAEASRDALQKSGVFGAGVPLVTEITPASTFWPAEMYHQDYYLKKAPRYKVYRYASGRDAYIESIWGASAHTEPAAQQM